MGVEYLYDFSVNDYSNAVLSIFRSFFFSDYKSNAIYKRLEDTENIIICCLIIKYL